MFLLMRGFPVLLALTLLVADELAAQQLPLPETKFQAWHTTLDRRGMLVLGGWALGNVGVSGARYFATEGREKYFHQMNVGWGVVNLALAGTSLRAARRPPATPPDRPTLVRTQLRTENLYLFNAGLDVAYLAAGLYLRERAASRPTARRQQQLRGYGQSLLLQGGFLLAFDGLMFVAHHRHASQSLYPLLSGLQVGPGSVALTLPIR
jgi:hypothetical protein